MATDQASTSACERGGGRLVSTEFEASKIAAVQASIAAAGLSDLVELRARAIRCRPLATDLPEHIDLRRRLSFGTVRQ